jgi:hypothetical protein
MPNFPPKEKSNHVATLSNDCCQLEKIVGCYSTIGLMIILIEVNGCGLTHSLKPLVDLFYLLFSLSDSMVQVIYTLTGQTVVAL